MIVFVKIINSINPRELVGTVANTLLTFTNAHYTSLIDDDAYNYDYDKDENNHEGRGGISSVQALLIQSYESIVTFFQRGNARESADIYLDKVSVYYKKKEEEKQRQQQQKDETYSHLMMCVSESKKRNLESSRQFSMNCSF